MDPNQQYVFSPPYDEVAEKRKLFWKNFRITVWNIFVLVFCAVTTILLEWTFGHNVGVICILCLIKERIEHLTCVVGEKK